MPTPITVIFAAGDAGAWRINSVAPVRGKSLPSAARLAMGEAVASTATPAWRLRGVVSNIRYSTGSEVKTLNAVSPTLGRDGVTCAALIPIKKSDAWWALGQDERRAVFEEGSRHIARSLKYLPAVARRLHHSRDLGEPFDFLTWFEFAPDDTPAFDALVADLRTTEEWRYVEREVDVRLTRDV